MTNFSAAPSATPSDSSTRRNKEDVNPNEEMFRRFLGNQFGQSLEERGFTRGMSVKLFIMLDENFYLAGTAKLGTAGNDEALVQRTLHLHILPQTRTEDLVVITGCQVQADFKSLPYPYTFMGAEGPPATLGEMYRAGYYAWDTRMMTQNPSCAKDKQKVLSQQNAGPSSSETRQKLVCPPLRKRPRTEAFDLDNEVVNVTPNLPQTSAPSAPDDEVSEVAEGLVDGGLPIQPRLDDVNAYHTIEVWIDFKQLIEPPETLRAVDTKREDLAPLFKKFGMDYSQGFMTITIRREDNPGLEDLKLSTILEDQADLDYEGNKVLSRHLLSTLCAMIVDGLHRKTLLSDVNTFPWIQDPIRIHLMLRKDGKDMTVSEVLKQSAKKNTVASAVRPFKGLVEHTHAALSYVKTFARENKVSTDQVRPQDLTDELFAASFLPGLEKSSYHRYSRIAKFFAKYPRGYKAFLELKPEQKPVIGAVHLDHSIMFEVGEDGVLLFLKSLDKYVRNPTSDGKFLPTPFYQCARDLYRKMRFVFLTYEAKGTNSFAEFLNVEIALPKGKTISIGDYFANQMRLFSGKTKTALQRNAQRADRFQAKIASHFEQLLAVPKVSSAPAAPSAFAAPSAPSAPLAPSDQAQPTLCADSIETKEAKRRSTRAKTKRPPTVQDFSGVSAPSKKRSARNRPAKKMKRETKRGETIAEASDQSEEGLDAEGYRIPTADSAVDSFDDKVPDTFPVGYEPKPVFDGDMHPWWQQALSASPYVYEGIMQAAKSQEGNVEFHTAPLLSALHVRKQHRANLYLEVSEVFFAYRMAWLKAQKQKLESDMSKNSALAAHLPPNDWDTAVNRFRTGEAASYFVEKKEELNQRGFCFLEGFADDSDVPDDVRNRLKPSENVRRTSMQEICDKYLTTFAGEEALKDEANRNLWNPIVNLGEEEGDKEHRLDGRARYTSTRFLLMSESEREPENVWVSVARARLDAWLGQLAVLLGLTNDGEEKMWMPRTGGRFLITGKDCPRQAPHNDFQVPHRSEKHKVPGYFIMVNGNDPFPLWFCDYSHHFVFNPLEELRRYGSCFKLRKIIVPPRSVFFGHGYATHAGAGYDCRISDQITTRYHIYLIPEGKKLPDSVFYAFGVQPRFHDAPVLRPAQGEEHNSSAHQGQDDGRDEEKELLDPADGDSRTVDVENQTDDVDNQLVDGKNDSDYDEPGQGSGSNSANEDDDYFAYNSEGSDC